MDRRLRTANKNARRLDTSQDASLRFMDIWTFLPSISPNSCQIRLCTQLRIPYWLDWTRSWNWWRSWELARWTHLRGMPLDQWTLHSRGKMGWGETVVRWERFGQGQAVYYASGSVEASSQGRVRIAEKRGRSWNWKPVRGVPCRYGPVLLRVPCLLNKQKSWHAVNHWAFNQLCNEYISAKPHEA